MTAVFGVKVYGADWCEDTQHAREFLDRFVAAGGVQCGACTPGIIVTAWALLQRSPSPGRE